VTTRVALVTGCGKLDDVSEHIVRALAACGVAVAVAGSPASQHGGEDEARRLVDETADRYGRLDILVNNAAPPPGAGDVWDGVIRVSLRGTYLMSRFAVPVMRRQRYGRIINIAAPGDGDAEESRAAVLGFTRALSADVVGWGITVNAIGATSPGCPGDIAAAVAYLASEAGGELTGQMLAPGGGLPPFPLPRAAEERLRHDPPNHPAVPRRPRGQPAAPAGPPARAR
jgi:3-oxoacyl-[acyl-carrier protein] reductase